jgi:hypothetical protein
MSAGALHPISALIIPTREDLRVIRYNPDEHCLESLNVESAVVQGWIWRVASVVPDANATMIILAADRATPNAVYENSESLIWRDAGALLQTIAMVSTAFRLAFCPLGPLGSEIVEGFSSDRLIAAGAALIGLPGLPKT